MNNNELQNVAANAIKHTYENYENAVNYLNLELQKIKDNPAFINNLGLLFYKKVEYNLACHCFYFLLENHDDKYYCHNNLGLAAHVAINDHVFSESKNYIGSTNLDLNPSKKIKLGYVSSDFREHAVGHFLIGIFEQHDQNKFEIHVFDNRKNNNDPTAKHLRKFTSHWHEIHSLNTDEACKLIQDSKIDVLVDLSGHTSGGRPDIFSNRVSPVQITYLGYPNTSGLSTMDFRIGDIYADLEEYKDQTL